MGEMTLHIAEAVPRFEAQVGRVLAGKIVAQRVEDGDGALGGVYRAVIVAAFVAYRRKHVEQVRGVGRVFAFDILKNGDGLRTQRFGVF